MKTIDYKDSEQLQTLVSDNYSAWSQPLDVTQEMIDDFAQLSGDKLWIHIDVERCQRESPLQSTIAHGFLILSLLSKMPTDNKALQQISGYSQMFNYGSNKLRFMSPVLSGTQIHCRNRVSAIEVTEKKTLVTFASEVCTVGQEQKPALIYELLLVLL